MNPPVAGVVVGLVAKPITKPRSVSAASPSLVTWPEMEAVTSVNTPIGLEVVTLGGNEVVTSTDLEDDNAAQASFGMPPYSTT